MSLRPLSAPFDLARRRTGSSPPATPGRVATGARTAPRRLARHHQMISSSFLFTGAPCEWAAAPEPPGRGSVTSDGSGRWQQSYVVKRYQVH